MNIAANSSAASIAAVGVPKNCSTWLTPRNGFAVCDSWLNTLQLWYWYSAGARDLPLAPANYQYHSCSIMCRVLQETTLLAAVLSASILLLYNLGCCCRCSGCCACSGDGFLNALLLPPMLLATALAALLRVGVLEECSRHAVM